MYIWYKGEQIHKKFIGFIPLEQQIPVLQQLSRDKKIPQYATHLIYLSSSGNENMVEQRSIDSIMKSPEKKADIYWFVHIIVTDEPHTMEYKVKTLARNDVYHLTFKLGFRIDPRVDLMFRTVVKELRAKGELMLERTPDLKYSLTLAGDHIFMLGDSYLSYENDISQEKYALLKFYYFLKTIAIKEEKNFGLEINNVIVEKYPLIVSPVKRVRLKRQMN